MFGSFSAPNVAVVALAGATTLTLVVVQMLIGYRKIRFQGRKHLKVHKAMGWVILGVGVVHATLAFIYFG